MMLLSSKWSSLCTVFWADKLQHF